MTAKQLGGLQSPDGSQYVTLTDGNGNIVSPSGGASGLIWAPMDNSPESPASAGSGYAVGDTITLNDGAATHAILTVSAVSSTAVSQYTITQKGSNSSVPNNPVHQLSTSGTGSGATFNLLYGPVASTLQGGTLTQNSGNLFIGSEQSPYFSGQESLFIGDRSGGIVGSGSFNTFVGHDANGIGSGLSNIYTDSVTAIGNDVLRNTGGASATTAVGNGVLYTYDQQGTAGNAYLFGTVAIGPLAMYYWNGAISYPWNTVIGAYAGAGTSASYQGITCIGQNTGSKMTTATNSLLIGGGQNAQIGATNFATGSAVVLIGSGNSVVDTPASNTTNYVNIENIITATGTGTPSTSHTAVAGTIATNGYTISTLPTSPGTGARAYITNGVSSPTYLSAVGTTGSTTAPVFYNGTAWVYG